MLRVDDQNSLGSQTPEGNEAGLRTPLLREEQPSPVVPDQKASADKEKFQNAANLLRFLCRDYFQKLETKIRGLVRKSKTPGLSKVYDSTDDKLIDTLIKRIGDRGMSLLDNPEHTSVTDKDLHYAIAKIPFVRELFDCFQSDEEGNIVNPEAGIDSFREKFKSFVKPEKIHIFNQTEDQEFFSAIAKIQEEYALLQIIHRNVFTKVNKRKVNLKDLKIGIPSASHSATHSAPSSPKSSSPKSQEESNGALKHSSSSNAISKEGNEHKHTAKLSVAAVLTSSPNIEPQTVEPKQPSPISDKKNSTLSHTPEPLSSKRRYHESARVPKSDSKIDSVDKQKESKYALCLPVTPFGLKIHNRLIEPEMFFSDRSFSFLTMVSSGDLKKELKNNDEILSDYLKSILQFILNYKWKLGLFGGKTIWNFETKTTINVVPKGMFEIADRIRDALFGKRSNLDTLDNLLELVNKISQDKSHGLFNRRADSTLEFYTQLKASLSTIKRTYEECNNLHSKRIV